MSTNFIYKEKGGGGMREITVYRQDTDKTKKVNAQVYSWKHYFKFLNRHVLQLMRR